MRHRSALRCLVPVSIALGLLSLAACSSGGGGGSSAGFQLTRISLLDGAVWKVNQEIVFTFSADVDFSSVSSNTISIQTTSGTPSTGTFFLRATNQVVFQPACPTRSDLTDTGLTAGGVPYVIRVLGQSSGAANTVRSTGGARLEVTQVRNFTTDDVGQEFLDTQQGPPIPVRIEVSDCALGIKPPGTFVELGDAGNRVDFLLDDAIPPVPGADQDGDGAIDDADMDGLDDDNEPELCDQGLRLPLNLYSEPASKIAVLIEFNQAINPEASNISSSRMRLEFLDGAIWRPLETAVTLVANCTQSGGARVQLEPIGLLPRNAKVRAVVLVGLEDLTRVEATTAVNDNFAVVPSADVDFPSLTPADTGADEFAEPFDFGGTSPLSSQDTGVLSEAPSAAWGDGRLTAAFAFEGGGGPGGDFDWLVADGDSLVVDTDDGAILSENGTVQLIDDGVVHLRNMTIEAGGEVRVQGTRPLSIHATGTVIIRGLLDVSGFDARDVSQINTGDLREEGGVGGPGGGRGGHANEIVTNSTARGGSGQGPLLSSDLGGHGGESGFATAGMGKDARRPGGGAGGRFARNLGLGLEAQNGLPGSQDASGALSNAKPPAAGAVSSGPFVDLDTTNDFSGTRAVGVPANVTLLIRGELPALWGGYGGGGGGNANPASIFPTPNWTKASDEKGGAGGGGGGGLSIRALGPIQFGASGQILCDGGTGAIGENVLAQDHVGGNGGSGSGGHVVLETASFIDFTDGGTAVGATPRDWIRAVGGPRVQGASTAAGAVSFGGAGGPGVIQLHVPDSLTLPDSMSATSDVVVPIPALLTGNAIDAVTSPPATVLIPAFAARSQARSEWISIGRADVRPGGVTSLLQFLFGGTDTAAGANEGLILVSDEDGDLDVDDVTPLAPLLDEDLEGNPDVVVLADRLTLRISAANGRLTGANDLYLRTPALLEDFVLRLSVAGESQDFVVASAAYDDAGAFLSMTVADDDGDLQDFIEANTALGTIRYELIPRFFRVVTAGVENSLPSTSFVRIRFQGAADDGTGSPDEANPLVDWTGDISQFNALSPGELQFFRFDVEFDLGTPVSADTQAISLDFLRIPFVF